MTSTTERFATLPVPLSGHREESVVVDEPGGRPPKKLPAKRKVKAKSKSKAKAKPKAGAKGAPVGAAAAGGRPGGPRPKAGPAGKVRAKRPPKRPAARGGLMDSKVVAAAVLAGFILVAAVIALIGLDLGGGDGGDAAVATTTSVVESPSTTDDFEVPFPTAPTATTVFGTATTAPSATPSTTQRTSPTTQASTATTAAGGGGGGEPSCGSGSVRAEPSSGEVTRDANGFHTPVGARVVSNFSDPVEVTDLVVRVSFQDGSSTDVSIDTSGVVLPPGASHQYDGPTVDSDSQPTVLEVVGLSYQPQGKPECSISG